MDVFVVYAGEQAEVVVQGVYSTLDNAKAANHIGNKYPWIFAQGGWTNKQSGEKARFIVKFGLDQSRFGMPQ